MGPMRKMLFNRFMDACFFGLGRRVVSTRF
jgi:hypothetical protein